MTAHRDRETLVAKMDRFTMPVPEAGCYAWLGKIGTGGYAYVDYVEGRRRVHRKAATVALELVGRPRPEGLEVDHTCRSRWCVNPDHMRYATRSENSLNRAPYAHKFCKRGHPLVGAKRSSSGACLICTREREAAWRKSHPTASSDYYAAHREYLNAQRRERRHRARQESLR